MTDRSGSSPRPLEPFAVDPVAAVLAGEGRPDARAWIEASNCTTNE